MSTKSANIISESSARYIIPAKRNLQLSAESDDIQYGVDDSLKSNNQYSNQRLNQKSTRSVNLQRGPNSNNQWNFQNRKYNGQNNNSNNADQRQQRQNSMQHQTRDSKSSNSVWQVESEYQTSIQENNPRASYMSQYDKFRSQQKSSTCNSQSNSYAPNQIRSFQSKETDGKSQFQNFDLLMGENNENNYRKLNAGFRNKSNYNSTPNLTDNKSNNKSSWIPSSDVNNKTNLLTQNNRGSTNRRGHIPALSQKSSATGTFWDVRDGRMWNSESVEDVFGLAKDVKSTGINFDFYDTIPVELTGEDVDTITPLSSFKEALDMHMLLQENILRVDYEKPTPVQKHSIPVIMAGRDLMACAQTGSGKTAGFLLPILSKMLTTGPPTRTWNPHEKGRRHAHPVTLILSPTRELAVQIYKESRKFAFNTGIQTVVVYGGSDHTTQQMALQKGCDICVATPGRLSEFASKNTVKLDLVKFFVLDEADRMLDMGFVQQIHSIASRLPSSASGRQTIMFSATFPQSIQELASEYLSRYIFLTVGRVGSTNNFISQNFIYSQEVNKPNHLISVLNSCRNKLVLIFVETRRKADLIKDFLSREKFSAIALHGDKSQSEREKALSYFRSGEKHILVATDVAARGLDIYNIEHVINLDLPARIEDYVHRIGRTGRAGNHGKATSFVNESNKPILRDLLLLLQEAEQNIPKWLLDLVRNFSPIKNNAFGRKNDNQRQQHGYHGNHYNSANQHNNNNNNYSGNNSNLTVGFGSRDARCHVSYQKPQSF